MKGIKKNQLIGFIFLSHILGDPKGKRRGKKKEDSMKDKQKERERNIYWKM